jgi:hypothetical protein
MYQGAKDCLAFNLFKLQFWVTIDTPAEIHSWVTLTLVYEEVTHIPGEEPNPPWKQAMVHNLGKCAKPLDVCSKEELTQSVFSSM